MSMDFLDKELERNKKYRDLLYKELGNDKKKFIKEIKSDLGNKILVGLKVDEKKITFWEKIKRIFR